MHSSEDKTPIDNPARGLQSGKDTLDILNDIDLLKRAIRD